MPHIGFTELVVILVVVLIIFGPGKLPQLGGALGKGISEFKKAVTGKDDDEKDTKKLDKPDSES